MSVTELRQRVREFCNKHPIHSLWAARPRALPPVEAVELLRDFARNGSTPEMRSGAQRIVDEWERSTTEGETP